MRFLGILALGLALIRPATSQTFKQHKIGETAEQFFSIATVAEHKGLTIKYCADYLGDPKVQKAFEKAQRNIYDTKATIQSFDVKGCLEVKKAFDGGDVEIGGRYAAEIGSGMARFHRSRLVLMSFSLSAGTPIQDVITDMSKELGGAEPATSVETMQNAFGATLHARRCKWEVSGLNVLVSEMKSFEFGDMGVSVLVGDSGYLKEKEAERQASRPNTMR